MPGAREFRFCNGRAWSGHLIQTGAPHLARSPRGQAPDDSGRSAALWLLLLAGDRLRLALAGAGIGVGALAANRQAAAVAQATIGAEIHEALDVHGHFAAEIAFHDVVAVDGLTDRQNLGVGELVHAALGRDVDVLDDLLGLLGPDAVDVLKRDHNALAGRDIDACYTGHLSVSMLSKRRFEIEAMLQGMFYRASGGGRPLRGLIREHNNPERLLTKPSGSALPFARGMALALLHPFVKAPPAGCPFLHRLVAKPVW